MCWGELSHTPWRCPGEHGMGRAGRSGTLASVPQTAKWHSAVPHRGLSHRANHVGPLCRQSRGGRQLTAEAAEPGEARPCSDTGSAGEHEPSSCAVLGRGLRGRGAGAQSCSRPPRQDPQPAPFKTKCLPREKKKKRQLQPRNSQGQVLFLKHFYFVHFELNFYVICFTENGHILKYHVFPPHCPEGA